MEKDSERKDDALNLKDDWSDISKDNQQQAYEDIEHETLEGTEGGGGSEEGEDFLEYPFHHCIEQDDMSKAQALLKVREDEQEKFIQSVEKGKAIVARDGGDVEEFVKLFGSLKDGLDQGDSGGVAPLHLAIEQRKIDFFRLFVEAGCDLNLMLNGVCVLHLVLATASVPAERNLTFCRQALALLLEKKVDLSKKDDLNRNCFHLLAEFNLLQSFEEILTHVSQQQLLGQLKVQLVQQDVFQRTPYHLACLVNGVPLFRKLCEVYKQHVDQSKGEQAEEHVQLQHILVNARDCNEMTCLDICTTYCRAELIQVMAEFWSVDELMSIPVKKNQKWLLQVLQTQKASEESPTALQNDSKSEVEKKTAILSHDICYAHHTVEPEKLSQSETRIEVPSENSNRLRVLLEPEAGILHSTRFTEGTFHLVARRAEIADVLRVHDYSYVRKLSSFCKGIPSSAIRHLDGDTAVSEKSFEAAMFAAGSVCQAVDLLVQGQGPVQPFRLPVKRKVGDDQSSTKGAASSAGTKNVFCCVRPPGHHAGSTGVVTLEPDSGSYGFCLLNNAAIGAAYARHVHRTLFQKVAIVDFDVHHGNGTEELVRNLVPHRKTWKLGNNTLRPSYLRSKPGLQYFQPDASAANLPTEKPYAEEQVHVNLMEPAIECAEITCKVEKFTPWLNETDVKNVMFVSTHGFGCRQPSLNALEDQRNGSLKTGSFYPSTGRTHLNLHFDPPEKVRGLVNQEYDVKSSELEPNIINIGQKTTSVKEWRKSWKYVALPCLRAFDPDLIIISAGFDAHKRDDINMGYLGVSELDYYWLTRELAKIANSCCNGRLISVLEGGYNISGGLSSPFAKSVASHVSAMSDCSPSELYEMPVYDSKETLTPEATTKQE